MTAPHRPRRRAAAIAAAAGAVLLPLLGGAAPAQAAGSFEDGFTYERGADVRVPWIVGRTLRDGDTRISLDRGSRPYAVDRVARGWVVADTVPGRRANRVLHVAPDGTQRLLASTSIEYALTSRGSLLATATGEGRRSSVKVTDVASGEQVARRTFRYSRVLGVDADRVLLQITAKRPRVALWNYRENTLSLVARGPAYNADLGVDRLIRSGSGPCDDTVVRVSDSSEVVARMKRLRTLKWNDTGRRTLTTDCYFDSPYYRQVIVRTDPGNKRVSALGGPNQDIKLSQPTWESTRRYLVVRFDSKTAQVLRCDLRSRCVGASRTYNTRLDRDGEGLNRPRIVLGGAFGGSF